MDWPTHHATMRGRDGVSFRHGGGCFDATPLRHTEHSTMPDAARRNNRRTEYRRTSRPADDRCRVVTVAIVGLWCVLWLPAVAAAFPQVANQPEQAAQEAPRLPQAVPIPPQPNPIEGDDDNVQGDEEQTSDGPHLFVTDRVAMRRLRLAEERIADGTFDEAVELLQTILDTEEDSAAPADSDDGTFYSLKGRASALIAALPPDGRQTYELKYGVAAAGRLADALRSGDWNVVEDVSRRHFYTRAGSEATWRLAIRAQDRGRSLQAAVLFEKLAGATGESFEPQLSLRTATAWWNAGFPESAGSAAERFLRHDATSIRPGGGALPAVRSSEQLLTWIDRGRTPSTGLVPTEWPVFRGNPTRSGTIDPVTIAGGAEWSLLFDAPSRWDRPREVAEAKKLSLVLASISETARETGELMQPAFSPIVAGDVAIFRTLRSIQAVDLATGRFLWRTEHPHDVTYDRAVDGINLFVRSGAQIAGERRELYIEEYVAQSAWRNLTSGTLSTDGTYVYGIEGVGTVGGMASAPGDGSRGYLGSEQFNTLYAYELAAEGRIAWTVGGPPQDEQSTGRFFLGPPLPLGGELYTLAEEEGEIRLVVLDPAAPADGDRVLWSQRLVGTEAPVASESPAFADPLRKISGLSPSFSDGILVCPTGTGTIVGVDLGRRLLAWGYQYPRNIGTRSNAAGRPPAFMRLTPVFAPDDEHERWLDASIPIADGRAYLTPRDSDELHCIELATGRRLWKIPRGNRLYLATVTSGRAVVVGRRTVEAFDATTGEPIWTQALDSAEPAGRGVCSGDLFHLPLASGEIMTLRLTTGQELGRSSMGEGVEAGNLVAANGRLVSQSTRMIAGFRRLADFENELNDRLAGKSDAELLALRGEHRLHRGDTPAGLADLRTALALSDNRRAKSLLTEGLLEGLRTDFQQYRSYESDLLKYADAPRQRLEFLRLFAAGLEREGDVDGAFASYLRLVDGGRIALPLEPAGQGRVVRVDRTLRDQITRLYESSDASTRSTFDRRLENSLRSIAAAGDTETLERFSNLFHATPAATEALTLLAARHEAAGSDLRRERASLRREDRPSNPTPRWPDRTDAAEPVASLAERFDVPYTAEYIPDEIRSGQPATEVALRFPVRIIGPRPPSLDGWQLEIDAERERLQARDPAGRIRWRVEIRPPGVPGGRIQTVHDAQARFSGHVMAFAAGSTLVVLDLLTPGGPSVLWSRELSDGRFFGDIAINRQQFRRLTSGLAFGPIGFAGAGQLLYQSGGTLVAADPLTGETFWQRANIPASCEISGDDEFVVLQPAGSNEAFILRTIDGSDPERNHGRSVDGLQHLAWSGTCLVSWKSIENGRELVCRDVARDEELWSRPFPPSAKVEPLDSEEVVVFDPPTGELTVFRIADGETVLTATIDPDPEIDVAPLRSFGQLLVFTRKGRAPLHRQSRRDGDHAVIDGPAYAFDDEGRRLWKVEIDRQQVALDQPPAVPILFLTTTVSADGRQPSYRAAILDVRTGRPLIEQNRERSFLPFELQVDGGTGTMTLAVRDGRFAVTPIAEQPAESAD